MSPLPTDRSERRTCITIDLENYSRLDGAAQHAAQSGLSEALAAAAAEAGLERMSWLRQESGDRELAVLPSEEDAPRAVGAFPLALDDQFRALHRRTGVWLRGRMAINHGMVRAAPMGISGWGPCDVTRLSDAPAVYGALRMTPEAYIVLAISAELYRDYVQQGHTTVKPEQFRQVPVPKIDGTAWVMLPGFDRDRVPVDAVDEEQTEPIAPTHQQVDATSSPVVQSARDTGGSALGTNSSVTPTHVGGSHNTVSTNDFRSPVQADTIHFGPRHG
jgi:hypothetical protein